jgi:membrane protease subunit HflC
LKRQGGNVMRIRKLLLILIGLILLGACAGYLTCFTVNENEYVLITRFGRTARTLDAPGLYFKQPYESVNRLDRRTHIFKNQPITLLLHDRNPIILSCYICWRILDPGLFFKRVKSVENASLKVGDMINSELGSVLGGYDLDQLINVDAEKVKLGEIEEKVGQRTQAKAEGEYGLRILDVGIRRMAYPALVENSVYNRMRAERDKEARKFRAEGSEEAAKIEAQTDLEIKKIMAEAYRDAEVMKGSGDREAMRIYAEAYGQDMEFYEFLKSLEIYRETLETNTTLILSTDSKLFEHLVYQEEESSDG